MIVLFNTNEYLGGGETLLLRLGMYLSKSLPIAVITSKNSYISKNINFDCKLFEVDSYDYYYMSNKQRIDYLYNIKNYLNSFSDLKIISFCFRDLYSVVELSRNLSITPFHLLLHPLDHLYLGQSVFDKIKQKISNKQSFSKQNILKTNKKIIENLNNNGLLISMNNNITQRIHDDFNIEVKHTIALPVFEDFLELNEKNISNKNIVWIGRLVDFKLPAIFAMIDFLHMNSEYTLNIIGYGEKDKVEQYINKKNNHKLSSQIKYLGKIEHKDLQKKIKEFDIGYAMGTSIIELSSIGLPTIVATASPNFELFDDELCSGMCYELGYGDVGDDLYNPTITFSKLKKISDCINKIEQNYIGESQLSFEKTKKVFSINKNSSLYQEIFLKSISSKNIFENIKIENADLLKKLIKRFSK